MLKHSFLDKPYEPRIVVFLGGIDIYDREETLGEELWKYDPSNPADRRGVIDRYILKRLDSLSYRHKFMLLNELKRSLLDTKTDFSALFVANHEEHESLAWENDEIENPRAFFEDIYAAAQERWSSDIKKAAAEDQSTW
ncbi:hypothetical protein ACFPTX_08335 [Pseudomonas sp. GCM10022188]|uniref:hypothetical protein n=1 Tax=Pseudomonas TaxID=286 RepID=UPI001E51C025|nr:hypothetical protein [Pseudomonas oryzagri]MCC6074539.1 hypothetical protein [Pseudomonas oryzagri]